MGYNHLNGRRPEVGDTWFRVDDPYGGSKTCPPAQTHYYVHRVTPRGVWLDVFRPHYSTGELRPAGPKTGAFFVLLPDEGVRDGGRRAAYPTVELARKSWLIRKDRQCQRLEAQLEHLKRWEHRRAHIGDKFWTDSCPTWSSFNYPFKEAPNA